MSTQVNSAPGQTEGRRKAFLEWISIDLSYKLYISYLNVGVILRILTGEKHPKIKLQRLRRIRILTFGSLVHQINSF